MSYKAMFGSLKREALWQRERIKAYLSGRGDCPICNLCDEPVTADQPWHESHHRDQPKVFGGKSVGVAHAECNTRHNNEVVTPAVAHCNRVRKRFLGLAGPGLGRYPMAAGRRSKITKTMRGGVQPRRSLAEKHAATMAKRAIVSVEVAAPPLAPEI